MYVDVSVYTPNEVTRQSSGNHRAVRSQVGRHPAGTAITVASPMFLLSSAQLASLARAQPEFPSPTNGARDARILLLRKRVKEKH